MIGDTGAPAIDLSECDREPIHIPGAIQPHGVLLAARPEPPHAIVHASANTDARLGLPVADVLRASLVELLGPVGRVGVAAAIVSAMPTRARVGAVEVLGRRWDGIIHRVDDLLVLELEPWPELGLAALTAEHAALRELTARVVAATSPAALAALLPAPLRRLTGYDRVMVYLFDDRGDGEVVAEDRDPALEPYLGQHYPASDIPAQARRLYVTEPSRVIVDARYDPVSIVPATSPATGAPLDLSHSVLRSVSPVHRAYLANMGVRASMSISLVEGDHLFGLIACHHRTPHLPRYELRDACATLGRVAAFVHVALLRDQTRAAAHRASRIVHRLVEQMKPTDDLGRALADGPVTVLDAVDATGAIVRYRDVTHVVGRAPPRDHVDGLVTWLGEVLCGDSYQTDQLPVAYPPAADHLDTACGVLAVRIGATDGLVAWLRPEVLRVVSWAGDPSMPVELDPQGRLEPRRSFALWREQVRGRALPFEPWEREVADILRRLLADVVLRRAAELDRVNRELRAAVQARDDFLSMASHELKTPLSTLMLTIGSLEADGPADASDPRTRRRLEAARRQVTRLDRLVSGLLDASRIQAGKMELDLQDEDLSATVRDVVERMTSPDGAVRVVGPDRLPCRFDRLRIDQVATNLISNAMKYAGGGPIEVELSAREHHARVAVRDHGPGIPPALRDTMFERFVRAPDRQSVQGFGLGLWITRAIVHAHGGTIRVEETPGGGATIVVDLPYLRPGEGAEELRP